MRRAALAEFSSNTLVAHVQDDVSEVDLSPPVASPLPQRRRIAPQLRRQVIEPYNFGPTSREVSEAFELGQSQL